MLAPAQVTDRKQDSYVDLRVEVWCNICGNHDSGSAVNDCELTAKKSYVTPGVNSAWVCRKPHSIISSQ